MTCKQCLHNKVCRYYLKDEDAERCKFYADKDEYIKVHRYKRHTNGAKKTIGQIIFEKRRVMGFTIRQLAERIGVCSTTLSAWELGKAYPNAICLVSLAEELGCTIDELCGME